MARKKFEDANVWDACLDRMRRVWGMADDVVVYFSGGKDSTVMLNAALKVHRELTPDRKLKVVFWDEEAIPMTTIDYIYREVEANPEVELHWFCLPIKHRNACSTIDPYWYCWEKEKEELWCRPIPNKEKYPKAIIWNEDTIDPNLGFVREPMPVQGNYTMRQIGCEGTIMSFVGLRASESLRRYRVVTAKSKESINYLSVDPNCKRNYLAKPIYDFTTEDVWTAHKVFSWDHNESYDHQEMAGFTRHNQRVCPPFGEEPLGGLYKYKLLYPELAEKMIARVAGASTAMSYARTTLYAFSDYGFDETKDPQEQIDQALTRWDAEKYEIVFNKIEKYKQQHFEKQNGEPIPLKKLGYSGISWAYLFMIAVRGDFKNRRTPRLN